MIIGLDQITYNLLSIINGHEYTDLKGVIGASLTPTNADYKHWMLQLLKIIVEKCYPRL